MNAIAVIVLASLLLEFALRLIADGLNLKASRQEIPEPLKGVYDPERYRKAQAYLAARTRWGWCSGAFFLAITLGFWFGGGFGLLDAWVRSFSQGPVAAGLVYIGVLALLRFILSASFRAYAVFGIENRFGFNTTSWRTFVQDGFKTAMLSSTLGVPLLALILWLFEYAGLYSWLYCWVGISFFMLCLQFLAPRWILPLFNTYAPLETGSLRSAIQAYARSVRFPLENIFVLDGSRRTTKGNAFFAGFGRHRRAALFDTLVAAHSIPELVAIFAHEIGHWKKHHVSTSLVLGILQAGLFCYLFSRVVSSKELFHAFGVEQPSVYAGLVFFALLCSPLDFTIGVLRNALSRRHELQADRFAVDTTGDRQSLAEALQKLSSNHLAHLTPHPFYVMLNYTHPPLLDRIRAIQKIPA
jgi:STE24 endopeptidase